MKRIPWFRFGSWTQATIHPSRVLSVVVMVLLSALMVLGSGCPGDTPLVGNDLKNVDLAVGDIGSDSSDTDSQILIYEDVLFGGSTQDPEIVITKQDFPLLDVPHSVLLTGDFTGNDLYALDTASRVVAIWRDYRDMATKVGPDRAPNVVLDYASSGICEPVKILHMENRLYVCDISKYHCEGGSPWDTTGTVAVFDHVGAVTTGHGDTPSLVLGAILRPSDMAVADDTLYVICQWFVTPSERRDVIYIYEHLTERIQGDYFGDPAAPSVVLGPNSFTLEQSLQSIGVFDGRLFIGTGKGIYVFDNANSLIDDQAPSAFLGDVNHSFSPVVMTMVGDTLYSGANWASYKKSDTASLSGNSSKLGSLPTFDKSVRQFDPATSFSKERNVLFASLTGSSPGTVAVYLNAGIPKDVDDYTFSLVPLQDFIQPIAIDTNLYRSPSDSN